MMKLKTKLCTEGVIENSLEEQEEEVNNDYNPLHEILR
jgi:hypothetical protein